VRHVDRWFCADKVKSKVVESRQSNL